jgi:hypothetical protein
MARTPIRNGLADAEQLWNKQGRGCSDGRGCFRFRGPERRPVIRASLGKLSHRLGFIAQALVVFPTLLKSACKQLFDCHRGIFLLQFF